MEFSIVRDDITTIEADAIVLPANPQLKEGSGASAAIFNKAGRDELKKELKRYKHVEVGNAVPTQGFNLPAKYIIHAVTPTWVDGKHDEYLLLSATYISALQVADKMDCKSVAFPLLASGNNGFDIGLALDIAVKSIESYIPSNELDSACIVVYGMNATQLAKDRGYDVEKRIDQAYVLEHSKDQIPQTKPNEVMQLGKDFVKQLTEDAFDEFKGWLNDPATRKQILDKAAEVIAAYLA